MAKNNFSFFQNCDCEYFPCHKTNNPDDLDPAVVRPGRLDKHLKIEKPNAEERQDIIERILIDKPIGQELYLEANTIAKKTNGKTPAEISSI